MTEQNYIEIPGKVAQIKAWIKGVALEDEARKQLLNIAEMPFIFKHIAVMPDCHWGMGATIGSVIATKGAVIPAAVGVDLGCGMYAQKTSLKASDLPDNLFKLRSAIEAMVPHGRTHDGGKNDKGAWGDLPKDVASIWANKLLPGWNDIVAKNPAVGKGDVNHDRHLGTLGTGNHFIEVCIDENDSVWVMLHSGSRGVGNRIGTHFINLAKDDMGDVLGTLPDKNLAYLQDGTKHFNEYVAAVHWAQQFALFNREIMMERTLAEVAKAVKPFEKLDSAIQCHHNYLSREYHFGEHVLVTRKGAVSAAEGQLGIIPGSMGTGSFIVRGKGNPESFTSCSHGAGRAMSRKAAVKRFTVEDHIAATQGVECRKDEGVLDETPAAYKPLQSVMDAQSDLVEPVYRLKTLVCVKG